MKDRAGGRHYLVLADARVGDKIELDGGFACCPSGPRDLHLAPDGLFFYCDDGQHYLRSQATDGTNCVGVYPMPKPQGPSVPHPILSDSAPIPQASATKHKLVIVDMSNTPSRASQYSSS